MLAVIGLSIGPVIGRSSWPTKRWPTCTPEARGLDAAALGALDEELARGDHGYVDGFLVIRGGCIVYEKTYRQDYDRLFASAPDRRRGLYNYYDPDWHPYEHGSDRHTMQSVSKSVTSALIGIAIRRGEIPGTGAAVLPYFEGYRIDADPLRRRWTLEDLLTMRAGIRWDEETVSYTDPANSCAAMEASADWVQFVLDQPMATEPGRVFVYNSGVSELLAQVLKKATGRHVDEYAAEHLFRPIGITRFYWKHTPTGHPDTEGGLYLAPRDLARFGYLYLHDGVWGGRRILPEGWVASSTASRVDAASEGPGLMYGYQWWAIEGERQRAFAALGYGGQRLLVVPDLDLIAVFTGWNIYDKPELDPRLALRRVIAAVVRP